MTLRCRAFGHKWTQPRLAFNREKATAMCFCQRRSCRAWCWVTKELPDPDSPHGERLHVSRGCR